MRLSLELGGVLFGVTSVAVTSLGELFDVTSVGLPFIKISFIDVFILTIC